MRLKTFKKKWKDCKKCPSLCSSRYKVVLYRGSIPSDILFIGEAPGDSEDVIGKPFVGPAGKVLDRILEDLSAFDKPEYSVKYCITNVVCCIPRDKDNNTRQPTKKEIETCRERLEQFIKIVKPKFIVTLGKVPKKNLPSNLNIPIENLIHPAALLPGRNNPSMIDIETKKCLFRLSDWMERYS